MTNNTERFTALALDAARTAISDDYRDNALARLIRDLTRLAATELLAATDANSNYYFSDSTYDELSNPSQTIHTCDELNDYFYDTELDDRFAALLTDLATSLDYHLSFALSDDEFPADFSLDDITAKLRTLTE